MKRSDKGLYLYCLALILVYLFVTFTGRSVPQPVRLAYLVLYFLPVLQDSTWCVAAMSIPMILMRYGGGSGLDTGGLLPSHNEVYLFVAIVISMLKADLRANKIPLVLFLFLLWSSFIDMIFDSSGIFILLLESSILLMIVFAAYDKREESLSKFCYLWICATFALSICFIYLRSNSDQYVVDLSIGESRQGWMDPNYFGTVLGMGAICAFIELQRNRQLMLFVKVLYIATIAITVIALLYNASRGAILALAISGTILLLYVKIKPIYKALVIGIVVGFLYYLYTNDVMNILIYRLENDDRTGNRWIIWADKSADFFLNYNPLHWLMGVGNSEVIKLGGSQSNFLSVHNDFLSIFFQYGIVGFILFIKLLFHPIYEAFRKKESVVYVLSATAYLSTVLFTLNPISGGQFPYFLFVFYIYALGAEAKSVKLQNSLYNVR